MKFMALKAEIFRGAMKFSATSPPSPRLEYIWSIAVSGSLNRWDR